MYSKISLFFYTKNKFHRSSEDLWEEAWADATIRVTEEGDDGKSNGDDDGLEAWAIALIVIACVLLLLLLVLLFLYCTGRICNKVSLPDGTFVSYFLPAGFKKKIVFSQVEDEEEEEVSDDEKRAAELERLKRLREARERSIQRQQQQFREGGSSADGSSNSYSSSSGSSSADPALEVMTDLHS